ncbi:MAG: rod shape-determining protein MreD [Gammaproteobacteria bacterium]|jgi:rod shape-determining protein MreD|nr:rod shape-determining protein MreD [Gammaproteobacteria bacterium]
MNDSQGSGYGFILLTFFIACVLAVVPLPGWLMWGRPEWVALALIYWTIALPHRVGILTALVMGVALDVLEGAVLGQNAFSLTVVTALALVLYQRVRVYSLAQQAAVVFVLIGINQLICQWVQNLQGVGARSLFFLLPALTSALLWPVVLTVLRGLRRHYQVS